MSFHQSVELSISAYEPLVVGTGIIDDSIGQKAESYSQTISALGGYESASISINDRQLDIENWLSSGLMRHIEVYNPSLVKIWEGFVNEIVITLGGLSVTRGPLLSVSNNVAVTYSTIDTSISPPAVGQRATTAFSADTDSQALYGFLESTLNTGGATSTEATTIRDVYLNENKDPQTSQQLTLSQNNTISMQLNCLGYYHLFKKYIYNQTASTGETDLDTVLAAIIAGDPNSIFSTDTSKITANTLQVKQYLNDNSPAWSLIQGLVARGDSSDNRYIFGIYNDRVPTYEAIPINYEYQQRLADPAQKIENQAGIEIKPWDVKAGKWLFVPDFLIGKVLPTSLRLDPRMIFIEQVTYSMPWDLSIRGGKADKLGQKLAKLGIGGIGSGVDSNSTGGNNTPSTIGRAPVPAQQPDFGIGLGTIIDDSNDLGGDVQRGIW